MEASAGREFPASGKVINDLPDEVLVKILSYSTLKVLMEVMQNVCSRWKRLSHDPELWRHKEYCIDSSCSDDEAVLMLQQMPQLRSLEVNRVVKASVMEAVSDHCSHLTTLKIHGSQKMTISLLEMLVQKCANIQSITVPDQFLWTEPMSQTLAQLNNLQSLTVLGEYRTSRLVHLRPLAERCLQLSKLKFNENICISYEDMEYFLNIKCKTLTHLRLPWSLYNQRCVLPLLKYCTSLSHLQVNDCTVLGDDAADAFAALGCLTNLHTLVVTGLRKYPVGVLDLAFESGGLSRLQVLNISGGNIEYSTLLAVCMHCPDLKELYLSSNYGISTEGLRQLYRLSKLEVFDLSFCWWWFELGYLFFRRRVDGHEGSVLETILNLTSLKVLRLNGTTITNNSFFDRIPENLVNVRSGAMSHLQVFEITCRFVKSSEVVLLCRHCPQLRELYLKSCINLTDDSLKELYRLSSLHTLDLTQCLKLGRDAIWYVAKLPNLRKLFLEEFNAKTLLPGLKSILNMTSLEVLNLKSMYYARYFRLDRIPEKLINLRVLDVRGSFIDYRVLDRLRKEMPRLQVKYGP